ncbi:larval cuticle protein 16/17-like [Spodoptera litura]|uniref:Cuticular protein RR-2 n=1 Tax=Spodoptera litura TaxID=69820 RepID=A0A4V6DXX7_SPOLT|nr:larval cuticle protein 16/17-like [Spodoptera litura]TKX27802.1 cuticular protein RR-2 [Spodoptera litura]
MDVTRKILLVISILAPVYTAPRNPRLTVVEYEPAHYYHEYDRNPQIYSFGYDVNDPATGNTQYRAEQRHPNGTVTGSYGYIDPYGKPVKYKYIADKFGYRVYSDLELPTPKPLPVALAVSEPTEPSITWTRPPKPHKKNVFNDIVAQLGSFFTNTKFNSIRVN